jgi:aminoglycoside/choline kinase family phosphotransferase
MDSEPNPGVIDFQDAVYGPISYDAICLFKDAFLSWPEDKVLIWLEQYWEKARAAHLPVPASFPEFLHDCDLMGAQRHLKVIGIFARIKHRDGKGHYLEDVPRFFAYLRTVIARRPELAALGELLDNLPSTES